MSNKYFLDIAKTVAKKSKDPNTKVGAIIVTQGRVQSTGYNGYVTGALDIILPKNAPDKYEYFIHAEINALLAAVKSGILIDTTTIVYLTHSPCPNCVRLMWQAGINKFIVKNLHSTCEKYKDMLDLYVQIEKITGGYYITSFSRRD